MAKIEETWHLWSTREGVLAIPQRIGRLPAGCFVSGDGNWAEQHDRRGLPVRVFAKMPVLVRKK
jgi:hypothetical protein